MGNVGSIPTISPMEPEALESVSSTCKFCNDFFTNLTAEDPPRAQTTVSNLLLRAERCSFCKALCQIINTVEPGYLETHPKAYAVLDKQLMESSKGGGNVTTLVLLCGTVEETHHRLMLYTPERAGTYKLISFKT